MVLLYSKDANFLASKGLLKKFRKKTGYSIKLLKFEFDEII